MALFIAKRRKEFNEGPLFILSIDGSGKAHHHSGSMFPDSSSSGDDGLCRH